MKPTFLTIVQMFQMEGMVALGKMLNPATNELTKNLEHARYVIDILEVISEKTKNNLDDGDAKFLENTLSTMRLNYLEETSNPSTLSAGEAS